MVQADSAFAAGDVAVADSLYYVAVRQRPRDPEARAALGRYLAAQGKAKVAIVLLEEARMFGGDPSEIARLLVPEYEFLGEWRALLTLPGSPLSASERKRAAWLSEHPFIGSDDAAIASIIGSPKGDTIARIPIRIGGRAAVAALVGTDTGFIAGNALASDSRRFGDSTALVFDSVTVGAIKMRNVPATMGGGARTMSIGLAAFGRVIIRIDYAKHVLVISHIDSGRAESRYPLFRSAGELRVLDRGRWVSLSELAAMTARASKTLIVDLGAGEVRVRP